MSAPSDSRPRPDEELGSGSLLGNYRLEERIGRGSFATVYRARHVLLERSVAIKLLHADFFDRASVRERFRREAVAMGKIDHPNVVSVIDFGETSSGQAFLVMEWVSGHSLAVAVRQLAVPIERAAFLTRQIAVGLGEAHRLGLIHRDLKPANVMLTRDEVVKIADFGLVRSIKDSEAFKLTQTGQLLGTPQYMSPEVIRGEEAGAEADLYALGVMLFEMIAGELPFRGKIVPVLDGHLNREVPPLPDARGLGPLARQLLAKVARDRPPSAAAVVQAIDAMKIGAWIPGSAMDVVLTEPGVKPIAAGSGPLAVSSLGGPNGSATGSYPRSPLEPEPPLVRSQLTPITARAVPAVDATLPSSPMMTSTVLRPDLRAGPRRSRAAAGVLVGVALLVAALALVRGREVPVEHRAVSPSAQLRAVPAPRAKAAELVAPELAAPEREPAPERVSEPVREPTPTRAAIAASNAPIAARKEPPAPAPASAELATQESVEDLSARLADRARALKPRIAGGTPEHDRLVALRSRISSERSRTDRARALQEMRVIEGELQELELRQP